MAVVLHSADEPVLTRVQMHRVGRAHRAHAEYVRNRELLADSDDDDGPQDDDAWLYEDLKVLTHLYSRLRDREQLIGLIFEVDGYSCGCFGLMNSLLALMTGLYGRFIERHYHDLLCAAGTGL